MALFEEIDRQRRTPFVWGETDCALFAADCVRAMTGDDPAKRFRGKYTSAEGAVKAIRKAGAADLGELAAGMADEIAPALAQVGDVATWIDDGNIVMGVVIGERVMGRTLEALGTVDRAVIVRAFRIP